MGKWEFAMFEQSPDLCFWVIAIVRKPWKQQIALCQTIRPEPKHSCGQFAKNKYEYWIVSNYDNSCLTHMEDFITFISTNYVKQSCTITLWPPACSRNQRCHHPTGCSLQSCAPLPPAHCVLLSVVRAPGPRIPRGFPPCAPWVRPRKAASPWRLSSAEARCVTSQLSPSLRLYSQVVAGAGCQADTGATRHTRLYSRRGGEDNHHIEATPPTEHINM